jgi:hypothetical protein
MNASIPQSRPRLPPGLSVAVWLSAFLSPTAYFLLILLVARSNTLDLPGTLVWTLFILVPVIALFICEWVAWSCSRTLGRKIGWMLFTLVAMLLQFAIILVILRIILVATIG